MRPRWNELRALRDRPFRRYSRQRPTSSPRPAPRGAPRLSVAHRVRMGFIGSGVMARVHMESMVRDDLAEIVAVSEPSSSAYAATVALFQQAGAKPPINEPDWRRFVASSRRRARCCVHRDPPRPPFRAGERLPRSRARCPAREADGDERRGSQRADLDARPDRPDCSSSSFQGSLSPQVRTASKLLRSGELGAILGIDAVVWQDWAQNTAGTWRQDLALSGGGFLFDTGAHMLNTVSDLAGEDFIEVAAWLENDDAPVDIRAVIMGRLASGALVTMHGCGSAIPSCDSDIRVFCSQAILRTGIWGERLELQRAGAPRARKMTPVGPTHVWQRFASVRAGLEPNPSPPEVGLRMAHLWDAIRESATLRRDRHFPAA